MNEDDEDLLRTINLKLPGRRWNVKRLLIVAVAFAIAYLAIRSLS
jgi:hypothetical protein